MRSLIPVLFHASNIERLTQPMGFSVYHGIRKPLQQQSLLRGWSAVVKEQNRYSSSIA